MRSFAACTFDETEVGKNWPPKRGDIGQVICQVGSEMSRTTKVLECFSKVASDRFRDNPSILYFLSELTQKLRERGTISECIAAVEFEKLPALQASDPVLNLIEAGEEAGTPDRTCQLAERFDEIVAVAAQRAKDFGCSDSLCQSVAYFSIYMTIFTEAGLSLDRSLRIANKYLLRQDCEIEFRLALSDIIAQFQGTSLSKCLRESKVFGESFVKQLESAEEYDAAYLAIRSLSGLDW